MVFEEKLTYECDNTSKQQEDLEILAKSDIEFEKYKNKTVFVTGATGLIGSFLVKTLLCVNRLNNYNIKVIAAVRNREKAEKLFAGLLNREEMTLYVSDIVRPIVIEENIDYIFLEIYSNIDLQTIFFHLAILKMECFLHFSYHRVMTIETSYQGTRNVLELARKKNIDGMVYVSSMEIYGVPDEKIENISEKDLGYIDIGKVRSGYSEGKRICECLCNAYASEYEVSVKSARLAQTFGAGVLENDNRVYVQFAKSAMEKKDIVLHTKGTSEGNYCYIRDAVKALLMLGYAGKAGEAYNVVNESTHMQIKEMAMLVADKIADGNIKVVYDIPNSDIKYGYAPSVKMKLSSDKLRKLGWQPEVDLEEMYERMIYDMSNR